MEFGMRTNRDSTMCTVAVEGELDVYTAPLLRTELTTLVSGDCAHLILDLDGLSFMDSSGLGVLVGALTRARENGGAVRIVCNQDGILKLFRITGLDEVFPIFSDGALAARF